MNRDWLPARRGEQLAMAIRWIRELPNTNGVWTVTPAEITELGVFAETAQEAVTMLVSGGAVDTERAREAFNALARCMRRLHSRKFFKPPMTDPDYVRLGLRPPDTVMTGHIAAIELVEFEIRLRGIRELIVDFRIKGAAHKTKPESYEDAVVVWDVLDAAPECPAELANHAMASRTPHVIEFDETERGKTAYIAVQWQNERGVTGPWSETLTAVIP